MTSRVFRYWAYATPPVALLLVGLLPFVEAAISLPLYLALPVYMIHQFEEHDDDRFAVFLNGMMGPGARGLSPRDVWVINVVFVWFFLLVVFYLARTNPAWAALAGYLLAINAALHVIWAAAFRQYNPGLLTAVLAFCPLAAWIFATTPVTLGVHVASAVVVLALHAAIMVVARRPSVGGTPNNGAGDAQS